MAASSSNGTRWTRYTVSGWIGLVVAGLSIVGYLTLVLLFSLGGLLMPAPEPGPSVEGPENVSLLAGVRGSVLHQVGQELMSTIVGSRETRVVQHDRAWFVSGPDDQGRYTYVTEGRFLLQRHAVHVATLVDGSDRVLFERPGSSNWHGTIRFVELAASGGHLAVGTRPYDPNDPFGLSGPVSLEIWDLDDGGYRKLPAEGTASASWFPDGQRLAIEVWVRPDTLTSVEPMPNAVRELHVRAESRHLRPAIYILDTRSNERTWLTWGSEPRVSPDGNRILVKLDENEWTTFDLPTGTSSPVSLPGALAYPCAWMTEDVLLYPAARTTGSDPGYTRAPGFAPTPNWTLKAARPGSEDFVTVVPCVRPYERLSFGCFGGSR